MNYDMNEKISEYLLKLEGKEDINILYACESGSRMWGIEFEDSDYDVRFIYHRHAKYYINLIPPKDVIDANNCKSDLIKKAKEEEVDIVGWDIIKFLKLMSNSNPTCFEWLNSPIQYLISNKISDVINISREYFNWNKIFMSYYGLAYSNMIKYLNGNEVYDKKYLYSIRPILICKAMLAFPKAKIVSLDFNILKDSINNSRIKDEIDKILLNRKSEKQKKPQIPILENFIQEELNRLLDIIKARKYYEYNERKDIEKLNEIAQKIILLW